MNDTYWIKLNRMEKIMHDLFIFSSLFIYQLSHLKPSIKLFINITDDIYFKNSRLPSTYPITLF